MMAGFPQLQRWHDEMVRRESFRKTWPQGYAVEDAGKVVAEMAVDKARAMYDFHFPDLDAPVDAGGEVGGGEQSLATAAAAHVLQQKNSKELGAFCL